MKQLARLILLTSLALGSAFFSFAQTTPPPAPTPPTSTPPEARGSLVIAEGTDFKVTVEDVERSFTYIPPQFLEHFNDPNRKQQYIEEFVTKIIYAKEATTRGFLNRDKVRRQIEDFTRNILYTEFTKEITDNIFIPNDEIKKYYDEHRNSYALPERIKLRHIQVKSDQDAAAVKAELDKGGDFAELAKRFSQDKATAQKGGLLESVRKGDLDIELEQVVFTMEPGKTAGPIKTRTGIEFVRVEEKRPTEILPLEAAKSSILNRMTIQKKTEILDKTKTEMQKKYNVNFYPVRYPEVRPGGKKPGVAPGVAAPGAPGSRPAEGQPPFRAVPPAPTTPPPSK